MSFQPVEIDVNFPEPLQVLFRPKRFKALWGGRSAGRSWGCARALLAIGHSRPIRVLCAREFMNSMADSVHKLLADQIVSMGLVGHYEVQQQRIIGKNGTSFAFEGIRNNVSRIKSYEGVDYCWVEEAAKVSRNSWGILIPTIRKDGSEIWLTFNPELETDYTYQRWALAPELKRVATTLGGWIAESADMYSVKMTYLDNPWVSETITREMEGDKRRDYDHYLHVWMGHCIQQLEGAIYAKQLRAAVEGGRICRVEWDRETPVDTWWDLGRADRTTIWFGQRVAMQYRLLEYYEDSGEDITHYIRECQLKDYNYGTFWLPHDAKAKRLGSKRTIEEIVKSRGYQVRIVPRLSVTDGINAARLVFPNCWFDQQRCVDGIDRLRHYHYRVVEGHLSDEPLHDEASDGADAFRYFAVTCRAPTGGNRSIIQRLEAAAQALKGGSEVDSEFSGRKGASYGWMQ